MDGEGCKIVGTGCKSHYCSDCCRGIGLALRNKLLVAVTRWKCELPLMLTLTIDPKNFDSPEQAMDYVRRKGLVSRLIRTLKRRHSGHVGHYFAVVEWQENEWPHWHILIDAAFIPISLVSVIWNGYGPGRPGSHVPMGFVWISKGVGGKKGTFVSKYHAACYVCKYVIKPPKHGWPQWVLNRNGCIFKRFTGSKGLFKDEEWEALVEQVKREQGLDDSELGYPAAWDEQDDQTRPKRKSHGRVAETIAGRVAKCGSRATVMWFTDRVDESGEIISKRKFVMTLGVSLVQVAQMLDRNLEGKHLDIDEYELCYLKDISEGGRPLAEWSAGMKPASRMQQALLFHTDERNYQLAGA